MISATPSQDIGVPIPENTPHAVSVTLPTWKATVGYEEGEDWVVKKMNSGYPRFFIHSSIQKLGREIEKKYGREGESCLILSCYKSAKRCREFMKARTKKSVRVLQLSTPPPDNELEKSSVMESNFGVVFFAEDDFSIAKQYWQHSGEGISSRMAEYIFKELFEQDERKIRSRVKQEQQALKIQQKSPSISASVRSSSMSQNEEVEREFNTFIEQKFGRVLDLKFSTEAKRALKKRICGKIDTTNHQISDNGESTRNKNLSENDVYLYPTGMASIFNAHQAVLGITKTPKKTVCFGFPYVDTLNILKKFGPGVHFLGFGDDASLDEMENKLESGEFDIQALFCECPSNPLLKTPNLKRIRKLADKYKFVVVVDETVGNYLNICVLNYADIVVSSLTKIFSGDSNVMGGSLILNPNSPKYSELKSYFNDEFDDMFWAEDALYLERNSRDFADRSKRIDENASYAVKLLMDSPLISDVYYPEFSDTKKYYDEIKSPEGGYGGLISFVFKHPKDAVNFFDSVLLHKGPSLGTNFTLACPYAVLAHYAELDEVEKWGVDRNLIRISIGLEEREELLNTLTGALQYAAEKH